MNSGGRLSCYYVEKLNIISKSSVHKLCKPEIPVLGTYTGESGTLYRKKHVKQCLLQRYLPKPKPENNPSVHQQENEE